MTIIQLSIRYFKGAYSKISYDCFNDPQLQSRYFYQLIYMLHNIRHSLERLMGKCQRIMIMNFLRSQELTDTAYTDKKGSQIKLYAVPNEDSIFPSSRLYKNCLSDKLINNMRKIKILSQ